MDIELSDFTFVQIDYEVYMVTYKNPITGEKYKSKINDMTIIDLTKDAPDSLQMVNMLKILKFICMSNIK